MKIAVCSLSEFTHVAEFIDAAAALGRSHHLRFFPGYRSEASARLLDDRRIEHECTIAPPLRKPLVAENYVRSTERLFRDYFFKHAELALPGLLRHYDSWRPDVIMSHLRDYAGSTAAEYLGIPHVSFGSHQSPWRIEGVDPPFGAGQHRRASPRTLTIAWQFHRQFNKRVDDAINSIIRRPLGLDDISGASTLHSRTLTLLSLPPFMSNKNSIEPRHIHFVGGQYTKRLCTVEDGERRLLAGVARSERPRLLLALGTTYNRVLLPHLLKALTPFRGTLVIAGSVQEGCRLPAGTVRGFFCNVDALHRLCDLVITTGAGKSVIDSLRQGVPMLCGPCQGEQRENALALESLGAARIFNISPAGLAQVPGLVDEMIGDPAFRQVADALGSEMAGNSAKNAALITSMVERAPLGNPSVN